MHSKKNQNEVLETTLALIERAYPGQIFISSAAVACLGNLTPASIRTLRCAGKFDLEAIDGNNRQYDIRDVAAWLDRRNTTKTNKKRGARTKVERAAAAGGASC